MSQKKRVRIYKAGGQQGAYINPTAKWMMQMGGAPQQQDGSEQLLVAVQQGLLNQEDPNDIYDDLVRQGLPAAQVEQAIYAVLDTIDQQGTVKYAEESGQSLEEVEEETEGTPRSTVNADMVNMINEDDDSYDYEDEQDFDDDLFDMAKGGIPKKADFMRQIKKLGGKVGQGQKPEDVSQTHAFNFLDRVKNINQSALLEKQAEEYYDNTLLPEAQRGREVRRAERQQRRQNRQLNRGFNQMTRNMPVGMMGQGMLPQNLGVLGMPSFYGQSFPQQGTQMPGGYPGIKMANIEVHKTGLFGRPKQYSMTFDYNTADPVKEAAEVTKSAVTSVVDEEATKEQEGKPNAKEEVKVIEAEAEAEAEASTKRLAKTPEEKAAYKKLLEKKKQEGMTIKKMVKAGLGTKKGLEALLGPDSESSSESSTQIENENFDNNAWDKNNNGIPDRVERATGNLLESNYNHEDYFINSAGRLLSNERALNPQDFTPGVIPSEFIPIRIQNEKLYEFVYGGSLNKYQTAGGTKEYESEQDYIEQMQEANAAAGINKSYSDLAAEYKNLQKQSQQQSQQQNSMQAEYQRQMQDYMNQQHMRGQFNPYGYANTDYGRVPTTFNPYGRGPGIRRAGTWMQQTGLPMDAQGNPITGSIAGQPLTKFAVTRSGLFGNPRRYEATWGTPQGSATSTDSAITSNLQDNTQDERRGFMGNLFNRDNQSTDNIDSKGRIGYDKASFDKTGTYTSPDNADEYEKRNARYRDKDKKRLLKDIKRAKRKDGSYTSENPWTGAQNVLKQQGGVLNKYQIQGQVEESSVPLYMSNPFEEEDQSILNAGRRNDYGQMTIPDYSQQPVMNTEAGMANYMNPAQSIERQQGLFGTGEGTATIMPDATTPDGYKTKGKIKQAWEIDPGQVWDNVNYAARDITNRMDDNYRKRNQFAQMYQYDPNRQTDDTFRGNYATNQVAAATNFRDPQGGQMEYSQEGGQYNVGEEVEMTAQEIAKFIAGGGKLKYV